MKSSGLHGHGDPQCPSRPVKMAHGGASTQAERGRESDTCAREDTGVGLLYNKQDSCVIQSHERDTDKDSVPITQVSPMSQH